jgi:hypothetical protein
MKSLLRFWLGCTLIAQPSHFCTAEETTTGKDQAAQAASLQEILKSEAEGKAVERSHSLKSGTDPVAKKSSPNEEAVHWHSGEIKVADRWQKLDDLAAAEASKELDEYRQQRGDEVLDVEGHRKMAHWCAVRKLTSQEHAHWYGVLATHPNDAEARSALGHEQMGGRWFRKEEITQTASNVKERVKALKTWLPKIKDMAAAIEGNDTGKRLKAIQQLKAIKDPRAVFAIQFAAERTQAQTSLHMINAIKRFQTKEACTALASIAVNDPTSEPGREAAAGLSTFPQELYVPALLDLMATEKDLRHQLAVQPNGELVLQLLQVRELKNHVESAHLDKVMKVDNSRPAPFGTSVNVAGTFFANESVTAAVENRVASSAIEKEAQRDADSQRARLDRENEQTRQIQRNVATVLRMATGIKLDDNPQDWWKWWDLNQEVLAIGNKEILQQYDRNFQSVVYSVDPQTVRIFRASGSTENSADHRPVTPAAPAQPLRSVIRAGHNIQSIPLGFLVDCLTAGTLIQTDTGLRPIESIRVGDNVVSQDVTTGELSLKPVIRTAERPPSLTCEIVLKNDTKLQATLGHAWWVIGKGWIKSKDLQPGMRIRTATSSIEVASLSMAAEVTTYNLSVADFNSYFVGEERLLSYDATEIVPSLQKVPGLPVDPTATEAIAKK